MRFRLPSRRESSGIADQCQKDISRIFREGPLIDEALNARVREAVLRHKQLAVPGVVWRGGTSVWIPPEEVPLPDSPQK